MEDEIDKFLRTIKSCPTYIRIWLIDIDEELVRSRMKVLKRLTDRYDFKFSVRSFDMRENRIRFTINYLNKPGQFYAIWGQPMIFSIKTSDVIEEPTMHEELSLTALFQSLSKRLRTVPSHMIFDMPPSSASGGGGGASQPITTRMGPSFAQLDRSYNASITPYRKQIPPPASLTSGGGAGARSKPVSTRMGPSLAQMGFRRQMPPPASLTFGGGAGARSKPVITGVAPSLAQWKEMLGFRKPPYIISPAPDGGSARSASASTIPSSRTRGTVSQKQMPPPRRYLQERLIETNYTIISEMENHFKKKNPQFSFTDTQKDNLCDWMFLVFRQYMLQNLIQYCSFFKPFIEDRIGPVKIAMGRLSTTKMLTLSKKGFNYFIMRADGGVIHHHLSVMNENKLKDDSTGTTFDIKDLWDIDDRKRLLEQRDKKRTKISDEQGQVLAHAQMIDQQQIAEDAVIVAAEHVVERDRQAMQVSSLQKTALQDMDGAKEKQHKFELHDVIDARYNKGSRWFRGRVQHVNTDGYQIKYADGDIEYNVKSTYIRRGNTKSALGYKKGDKVQVMDYLKNLREADIVTVHQDGTFSIKFIEGGEEYKHVLPEYIYPSIEEIFHQECLVAVNDLLTKKNDVALQTFWKDKLDLPPGVFVLNEITEQKRSSFPCVKGNGVFATDRIPQHTWLGMYPGNIYNEHRSRDYTYVFKMILHGKNYELRPSLRSEMVLPRINSVNFDNYSKQHHDFEQFLLDLFTQKSLVINDFFVPFTALNCEVKNGAVDKRKNNIIFYYTQSNIETGEELITNYGESYLDMMFCDILPTWERKLDDVTYAMIKEHWDARHMSRPGALKLEKYLQDIGIRKEMIYDLINKIFKTEDDFQGACGRIIYKLKKRTRQKSPEQIVAEMIDA